MDIIELLQAMGLGQFATLALAIMGLCAAITATVPAPTKPPALVVLWRVLNVLGANVRHARNREASDKGGLGVGDTLSKAKPPD